MVLHSDGSMAGSGIPEDWLADVLSISDFCDPQMPPELLPVTKPSKIARQARSKPSLYDLSDDEDEQRTPLVRKNVPAGRGYILQRMAKEKRPSGTPSFMQHQQEVTKSIREINPIGYSNEQIVDFLNLRDSKTSSSVETVQEFKPPIALRPSDRSVLGALSSGERSRQASKNSSNFNSKESSTQSSPTSRNDVSPIDSIFTSSNEECKIFSDVSNAHGDDQGSTSLIQLRGPPPPPPLHEILKRGRQKRLKNNKTPVLHDETDCKQVPINDRMSFSEVSRRNRNSDVDVLNVRSKLQFPNLVNSKK